MNDKGYIKICVSKNFYMKIYVIPKHAVWCTDVEVRCPLMNAGIMTANALSLICQYHGGRGLASTLADLLFPGLEAGIGSIFFRQDRAGVTYSAFGFRGNV